MKILLLQGVNLNTLGTRQPEIYGSTTLAEINDRVTAKGRELGVEVQAYQSNIEGELINFIQQQAASADGIVINPGAWTHYSIALRDALAGTGKPFVEVHLSNIFAREPFREHSVLSGIAKGIISGLGWRGYVAALESLVGILNDSKQ